ncbi:MAG: tRNA 2-thiouridine(34) synthase MnmA [Candidatus Omnitrophota bacterium]|jgi:tRNA-specific 2-thiouridylase
MNKKKRVAVAMSGGVDSSVAAAILQKKGYDVFGMTMYFDLAYPRGQRASCGNTKSVEDAKNVAKSLGIPHKVVDISKVLQEKVIKDFCRQYLSGKTPNPCVRCNELIKFGVLFSQARAWGAEYVSTGHYARLASSARYGLVLKKAKDLKKDQSYFLYRVSRDILSRVIFPLGTYTKGQVRSLAFDFKLPVSDKPDSQEICFLPQSDYREFLKEYAYARIKPGRVIDARGNLLGEHQGAAFYTIGQRGGLGIALGHPAYVTNIDYRKNTVTLGAQAAACSREFLIKDICGPFVSRKKKIALKVKIRYNHKEMPAELEPVGEKIKAVFAIPQFAITPGQSAVFYDNDCVLGGGIIEKVFYSHDEKNI